MASYEPGYWLNADSRKFLSKGYLKEGETAEERIRKIAETAESILGVKGFADRLEDIILRGWISLSSPIWSNFGNPKVLPISCNGSFIEDTIESILGKNAEIGMMTKLGAGTSAYLGELRGRGQKISTGGTSNGPVHFLEIYQTTVNTISQSNVRRGNGAFYLPVEHPDIEEFLECREEGHVIQHVSIGVTITDRWMEDMIGGDKQKRKIWTKIIKKRFETGYPYVVFTDAANRGKPDVYKTLGMMIYASNLCTEIFLPSSPNESFVCDLLSMNLLHYDEWKDTDAVEIAMGLLDAVMSEYIKKTEGIQFMEAARNFAINHRAVGLGVLGWHSYLQSRMVPFGSQEARKINIEVFKNISEKAQAASEHYGRLLGPAPLMEKVGKVDRNTTKMAIAPTTSSSFILGGGTLSQSIEPDNSNYFVKDLQKGKFTVKNVHLKKLLKSYGKDTKEVWEQILMDGGSVRKLDFLTDHEREVFKTFGEISQSEIVGQAADRQKFIDQGQSLNLMIHPDTPLKQVNQLMIDAWALGLKSLYYQRSTNPAQEYARELIGQCVACEA